MKTLLVILTGTLLTATTGLASTPAAWKQHTQTVTTRCLKASGFANPQPVGEIVTFTDQVGYDVLLVRGNYPQPHMHNQVGQSLCLYNRRTHQAVTNDASGMIQMNALPATPIQ